MYFIVPVFQTLIRDTLIVSQASERYLCLSRETVIAVTTNIESMELRRCQNGDIGYEEHPRAGTTDDVEAIIAFLHRILGVIFTLKQFNSGWRLVVRLVHR